MKLGLKIILPILSLLVIVTGAFGYIFYNLKQQELALSIEGAKIRTLNGLNERLGRDQDITDYNVLAYRFDQNRALLLEISKASLDKSITLDAMYPFITTSRGRELVKSYLEARKEIESLRNALIRAIDEGDKKTIGLRYDMWNIQTQNVKATLADIGTYNINSLERTLVTIEAIRNKISEIIIILIFVVIATILFLFFYLKVVVTTPIIKLAQFADEVANKNFTTTSTTTTTTTTTRKDELGMLSRALNTMVIKLKESYVTLEQKVRDRTQDLEHENAKNEAVLSNLGEGVAVADETGKLIYFNKAAEQITGMGKAEGSPDTWQKEYGTFYPDTVTPLPTELVPLVLAFKGKTVFDVPLFLRNKKIPVGKFVSVTATPILLNGKRIGGVAIFRDITEQKRAMEVLKKSQEQLHLELTNTKKFQQAVESSTDAIIITDAEGAIFYVNPAWEKLMGYQSTEVLGKNPNILQSEKTPRALYQTLWKTIKDGKPFATDEIINRRKDGTEFEAELKIYPIFADDERTQFFVGVQHDITEWKRADRAKTEFVSLASHQLGTPLTEIRWALSSIAREVSFDPEHKETIEGARNAVTNMSETIRAMLTIAHIESGNLLTRSSRVQVKDALDATVHLLKAMGKRRGIKTILRCPETLCLETDEQLLKEILTNLLVNAYKYTPRKGTVTVQVKPSKNTILIEVSDTGFGIPLNEQGRIFQKFFRATNIAQKDESGSGLGLYLVYSVAKLLGGSISFVSKEGLGTTFILTLPSMTHEKKE